MPDRLGTPRMDSIVPTFGGYYLERLLSLVQSIHSSGPLLQSSAVGDELQWFDSGDHSSLDAQKYKGLLLVLRDITRQGWQITYPQKRIMLLRPEHTQGRRSGGDVNQTKERIRAGFQPERIAQLNLPSTVRFIQRMEHPSGRKRPVTDLLEKGDQLATRLRTLALSSSSSDVAQYIDPYLQLVTPTAKDAFTGQRLTDIWRYLRYSWAIPYQSTPGRNMFYLVRDAAHPSHAVMGIAALGNCVAQLSDRDRQIGWSVDAIDQTFARLSSQEEGSPPHRRHENTTATDTKSANTAHSGSALAQYSQQLAALLESALDRELSEIDCSRLASAKECESPTGHVIARLLQKAADSEYTRRQHLRAASAAGKAVERESSYSSIRVATRSPLFVRKRAKALADVLFAKTAFRDVGLRSQPTEAISALLGSDAGRKALRIALHANKKAKVGTNMMDIIVCGAIPPYNDVLGGKLTAMLMASPQVVRDYKTAYCDCPGEIVSRIAGRPIVRTPDLVLLTTTSLYYVGSSQYERIKIPAGNGLSIRFQRLGKTEGFGSTALSSTTAAFLRQLSLQQEGYHRVNHVFGEGVSPKLRMTRDGLTLVGVPQEFVLKHDCPRLVYGVQLATNAYEYLRGEHSRPRYILGPRSAKAGTRKIIDHWITRWLLPRIRNADVLARVSQVPPDVLLLSKECGHNVA